MRAVVSRVTSASVSVAGREVARLPVPGLLVLLGVARSDGPAEVSWMARKLWTLRILQEEQSASEIHAPLLVVSQFTLYGDARKGRRPTWEAAAGGDVARPLYEAVCAELESVGAHVERGVFGAEMQVASVNDGPFTVWLETPVGTSGPSS